MLLGNSSKTSFCVAISEKVIVKTDTDIFQKDWCYFRTKDIPKPLNTLEAFGYFVIISESERTVCVRKDMVARVNGKSDLDPISIFGTYFIFNQNHYQTQREAGVPSSLSCSLNINQACICVITIGGSKNLMKGMKHDG